MPQGKSDLGGGYNLIYPTPEILKEKVGYLKQASMRIS
jgi:hypothetical protein